MSRLPRRAAHQVSVAELVKKYQEYLPPQGVEELAKTALSPAIPISESETECLPQQPFIRPRVKGKLREPAIHRKASVSDFEQSYAANIAPKYLAHNKRTGGQLASRIPGPILASTESRQESRRTSPDKRPSFPRTHTDSTIRPGRSSPPYRSSLSNPFMPRGRLKSSARTAPRDKPAAPRPTSVVGAKNTVKRASGPGNKVSHIAKHFERINRDNERANRRYAVIRGRRARPVAMARAKVEILESIKDAIRDEEESDTSDSSEADDEGGDDDEANIGKRLHPPSSEGPSEAPTDDALAPTSGDGVSDSNHTEPAAVVLDAPSEDKLLQPPTPLEPRLPISVPPSPAFPPAMLTPAASPTELDIGSGADNRHSILKTLAGLWPQQNPPIRQDGDDPMSDPEHIFRDSSMVVRTDEPTSIIALALK